VDVITAPAERWDIVVDFSAFAGQKIVLYNDAPAPFPEGSPLNDYFPGADDNPITTSPGFGPNTRQIMRFNVASTITGPADPLLTISPVTDLTAGNEAGWKETVRMNPGEVTTVIMQFKLPTVPFTVPSQPTGRGNGIPARTSGWNWHP
jgi:hypothetical protein